MAARGEPCLVNAGVIGRPANDGRTNVWYTMLTVGAEASAEFIPIEYDHAALSTFTPRSNSIDPNLRDPKTDEITLGYERELTSDVGFSVLWVQRWFSDQTVDVNVAAVRAGFETGPGGIVPAWPAEVRA